MILFKPYPPCCPQCGYTWPDIQVSNNFWSKSINGKLNELISINTPALADYLDPQISTLQSGTDLVQGG